MNKYNITPENSIFIDDNNENIIIGNFIADAVKGKKYNNYPKEIKAGILLHREIDNYTDNHPIVKKSKRRLNERYRHYNGVIIDILYDHFLAKNWERYSNVLLTDYVETFYDSLEENYHILPLRVQKMMPYMMNDNWLVSYASLEGISKALDGMNRRTKYRSNMNEAVNELEVFYSDFETEFSFFFEELVLFSNLKLNELNNLFYAK